MAARWRQCMLFRLSLPTAGELNIQRGGRNKLTSYSLNNFILNPLTTVTSNPLQRGSQGWGMFLHQNHAAGGEYGSSWWWCLCDVCLASQKHSKWEFFVPTRMDVYVGVKLLRNDNLSSDKPLAPRGVPDFVRCICTPDITYDVYFSIDGGWLQDLWTRARNTRKQ